MSLEYWAPHQDPEGETTELDLIAASTLTLDGLVKEVRRKLARRTTYFFRSGGSFRSQTIPGGFYLRDTPDTGGVRIMHWVVVQEARPIPPNPKPRIEQRARYEIFSVPDGLSGSTSVQLREHYELDRGGGYVYGSESGRTMRAPPNVPFNAEMISRNIADSERAEAAELAERQAGLDFLSEAGAQRLQTHLLTAMPTE